MRYDLLIISLKLFAMKKMLILVAIIFTNFCVQEIVAMTPLIPPFTAAIYTAGRSEKIFLKHAEECLAIICQAAGEIPMTGVAMVAFIPGDTSLSWISKMKVAGRLADDKANILGIVYTKAAEMAATLKNSGNPDRKDIRGEFGYIGGVIKKVNGGYLLATFSGGKGEDDVAVARKGLEVLVKYF
jgi:hypothetical protein